MINSMIRCNMNQEAMKTVENLASFYRISLNNGSSIISISKEIQLIESYLCLQKMRYIEFMDYVLAFSPAIYDFSIPKLTLQPLIENAIIISSAVCPLLASPETTSPCSSQGRLFFRRS